MKSFKVPIGKGKFRWVSIFRDEEKYPDKEIVFITSHSLEVLNNTNTPELDHEIEKAVKANSTEVNLVHTTNRMYQEVQSSIVLDKGYVLDILQGTLYIYLNGQVFYLSLLVPNMMLTTFKVSQSTLQKFGHQCRVATYPEGTSIVLDGYEPEDPMPMEKAIDKPVDMNYFEQLVSRKFQECLASNSLDQALTLAAIWEKLQVITANKITKGE